jgi:hypothetical protein
MTARAGIRARLTRAAAKIGCGGPCPRCGWPGEPKVELPEVDLTVFTDDELDEYARLIRIGVEATRAKREAEKKAEDI